MGNVLTQPLDRLIRDVERALTAQSYRLNVAEGTASAAEQTITLATSDHLSAAAAFAAKQLKTHTVFVSVPASQNTESQRGRTAVEVADQVVVTLAYPCRPQNQRASRDEGMRLESLVIERIMALRGPLRLYRPTYVGAARGPAGEPSVTSEWWATTLTFQFLRLADVE